MVDVATKTLTAISTALVYSYLPMLFNTNKLSLPLNYVTQLCHYRVELHSHFTPECKLIPPYGKNDTVHHLLGPVNT